MNLHAGVVVIELAHHAVALRGHDARQNVAQSALAGVAEVQRAGRVGRDVLEKHALAFKSAARAVGRAQAQYVAHGLDLGVLREAEIDKARSGDLDVGKNVAESGVIFHGLNQRGSEFAGIFPGLLGALQRDRACDVAVTGLLGTLQTNRFALKAACGKGAGKQFGESLFLIFDHFSDFVEIGRKGGGAGCAADITTGGRKDRPPLGMVSSILRDAFVARDRGVGRMVMN